MAVADVKVIREELVYRPDVRRSYFKDMVAAESGDFNAAERLRRHAAQVADLEVRADAPEGVEFRTNPTRVDGQGGYFAPPLWINERFATYQRPGRVVADLIPTFELPSGVGQVNVPRLTAGTSEQPVADDGVDPDTDITDAAVSCKVVTISGDGVAGQQLLDQSPAGAHLDWVFFKDMSEAYDAQLEAQILNGSGTGAQLPGMLALSGIGAVTYTSGSPTATGMYTYLGQTIAAVGKNRKRPPECWLMSTSRLAWLGSSEDTQNRPLVLTDRDGTGKSDLLTFDVQLTDAMPTNLGAGANQDAIIACRPSDFILLESTPRTQVSFESNSGTLQVRIRLHHYVAVLFRYPSAIAALQGTGMVPASGF